MTSSASSMAFDEQAIARWNQLIEKSLGEDALTKLSSATEDGITLQPLYPASTASSVPAPAVASPWTISQRVDVPDPENAAEIMMADLEGGASGVTLVGQGGPDAYGFGIDPDALDPLLEPVLADAVRITFLPSNARIRDARMLSRVLDKHVPQNRLIQVDFGLDVPSLFASSGALRDAALQGQSRHFDEMLAYGFGGTIFRADGRVVHEAGGTEAQELGFVLASLVFMMRAHPDAQRVLEKTLLGIAVDADQFGGIAKVRALKLLHASVVEACGASAVAPQIHATTSLRMLTIRDPNVNMLRNTVATFAAAIGGADIVTSLPHTMAHGCPDPFARRVARNTQLILASESNLYRVADPAAGSGLYESYTDALCERAWAFFQDIEARGGIIEALKGGFIQEQVAEARKKRSAEIESKDRLLTGSTIFPLETEYPVETLPYAKALVPLHPGLEHSCEPLAAMRLEPQSEAA